MSLASIQSDVDAAMVSVLSSIASAQATYYASKGYYFASPWSHTIHPADGNSVAADNLSEKLAGYNESWTDFGVNPGTIPCAVKINAYKSGSGHGYTVSTDFTYSGGIYTKASDVSGGASGAAVSWQSTADPLPPDTYSSTSEAYCTSGTDNTGTGTIAWTNPGNITTANTTYATIYDAGITISHYLLAKTYGFAIPSTAVIDGILVTYGRYADDNNSSNRIDDSIVKLFYSGSAVGTSQSTSTRWSTTVGGTKTFGSSTSNWGYNLTPTIVNDSSFGVGLAASLKDTTGYVDYVKMKVYYTVDAVRPLPTITSLSVSSGTVSGGTTVVITGTGFKNGISGTLGGNTLTFTSLSSTSLTFSTPAHAAGAVDLVLTNIDGKSVTSSSAYTYAVTTPAFVKYGSGTASSTSDLSLAWSGGSATAGNCLLAVIKNNSGGSVASSSGWTQLQSGTNSTTCWYKIAVGGDSAVWTWGGSAKADKAQGLMIELSGSSASSPIDVSAASLSTFTTPSVTTSTATLVVSLGGGIDTGDFATQPSGWTLALHGSTHNGTGIAYKVFSSSGATGTADWGNVGSEVKVFTVAVKA